MAETPKRTDLLRYNFPVRLQLGQYHTLELELNRQFTLSKAEWDSIALERISTACDFSKSAEVAAVVLQEGTKLLLK